MLVRFDVLLEAGSFQSLLFSFSFSFRHVALCPVASHQISCHYFKIVSCPLQPSTLEGALSSQKQKDDVSHLYLFAIVLWPELEAGQMNALMSLGHFLS